MSKIVSLAEYLVAALMIIGGISTGSQSATSAGTPNVFSLVFNSQSSLVFFGIVFFILGAVLFYAKIRKNCKLRLICLMNVYLLMVFATVADITVTGFASLEWVDSVILGIVAALCHAYIKTKEEHKYERRYLGE